MPNTVCQPAEIEMFLGDVTKGRIVSWTSAEFFDPTEFGFLGKGMFRKLLLRSAFEFSDTAGKKLCRLSEFQTITVILTMALPNTVHPHLLHRFRNQVGWHGRVHVPALIRAR